MLDTPFSRRISAKRRIISLKEETKLWRQSFLKVFKDKNRGVVVRSENEQSLIAAIRHPKFAQKLLSNTIKPEPGVL